MTESAYISPSPHAHKQPADQPIVIAAFYHFFDFPDFAERREEILAAMQVHHIKGSLLITSEGFNSTLSGTRRDVDQFLRYLATQISKSEFEWKESYAQFQPFGKARVRLKKETISCGEECPPNKRGTYLNAQEWNELLRHNDVVILDTRNDYEVNLGTFKGAIDPQITNFKQLPQWTRDHAELFKGKKIATFCTGGIRCEKFTAWMNHNGFEDVYHLKGGILQYFEDMPKEDSLWEGECFVFDERIAVDHELNPSQTATLCAFCDHALTAEDQASPLYVKGSSCPHCHGAPEFAHDRPPTRKGRTRF